jgi:hypothetical protein
MDELALARVSVRPTPVRIVDRLIVVRAEPTLHAHWPGHAIEQEVEVVSEDEAAP